jgi:hypothetical protein
MNDTELDQLLDTWSVPPTPASLRGSVRAGFAARPERKRFLGSPARWISLFAAAILAMGAFLLVVALALPQTLGLDSPPARIPYTVDSEIVRYANDGSSSVEANLTSYNNNGSEIVLFGVYSSFSTAIRAAAARVGELTLPFVLSKEQWDLVRSQSRVRFGPVGGRFVGNAAALLQAGCVSGPVVGRETILNHPTVAVRRSMNDRERMTLWMAPDLGCFALRITIEHQQPDGTFRLGIKKQAVKVTVNP